MIKMKGVDMGEGGMWMSERGEGADKSEGGWWMRMKGGVDE